jgi:hypothetical protein
LPQGRDGDAAFMKLWSTRKPTQTKRIVADQPLDKAMLPDAL